MRSERILAPSRQVTASPMRARSSRPSGWPSVEAKRWRDIWSAGQGVDTIHDIKPIGAIVEDVVREYHDAVKRLTG